MAMGATGGDLDAYRKVNVAGVGSRERKTSDAGLHRRFVRNILEKSMLAALALLLWTEGASIGAMAQCHPHNEQQIDSLRSVANVAADCSTRVAAWEHLCNWYYMENDSALLLAALRHYESEAQACGDKENFLYARMWRLASYYNYSMRDSFFMASDSALRLFSKYGHDRFRYEVYRLRVQYYLFSNEFHDALQEAEQIVRTIRDEESSYGMGMGHFCLGYVFQLQYVYETAAAHFSKALHYLKKGEKQNQELRLHCFERLADCYASSENYSALDSINRLWRQEFLDGGVNLRDTSGDNPWQLALESYYISRAHYCLTQDSLLLARSYLDTAERFVLGVIGGELSLLIEQEEWYRRTGYYDSAMAINNQLLAMNSDGDVSRSQLDHMQMHAKLLYAQGHYQQAARLYDSLLTERNAIFKASTVQATMEVASILERERTRRTELRNRLYMVIAGIVVAFSSTLAVVFLYRSRKTLHRNRLLAERVERLAMSHDAIVELQQRQGLQQAADKEQELYERLEALMRAQHPYLDPKLNRESLARELGSNSTYLASAIKTFGGGMTVGNYITHWRVAFAVHLLRSSSLRVSEIASQSGFISRATMNRAFSECLGMSPSEYRETLQDQETVEAVKASA